MRRPWAAIFLTILLFTRVTAEQSPAESDCLAFPRRHLHGPALARNCWVTEPCLLGMME